jgi:hypothetical protein
VRGNTQTGRVFIVIPARQNQQATLRRQALSVVRDHFRAIHATIPRLEPAEKVPLPDNDELLADYATLLKMEAARKDEYWPDGADHGYSVKKLLGEIEDADDPAVHERRKITLAKALDGRSGISVNNIEVHGDLHMSPDQSRNINARDINNSSINLGEIHDSVVTSIQQIPPDHNGIDTKELKEALEQLTDLLKSAVAEGVDEQVAADAMGEVKALADAAAQPRDNIVLGAIKKTMRTLRGFAKELAQVPALAKKFVEFVDHIGKLI